MRAEQMTAVVTDHGEGPVWSPRWAGPRWVDMLTGDICELHPDGTVGRRHVEVVAAMIRPRADGGYLVAGERRLYIAEDDDLDAPLRACPEILHRSDVRMNEGGCDPSGQLYLGSMAYDARSGGGKLYRIPDDAGVETVEDAVTISNGIDWSPDNTSCYYVDSATHRIDQYDWTPAGLSDRRPLVEVSGDGMPDGLTVDADGNIWVAMFGGGQVRCYAPTGGLEYVLEVPVAQVTAVTFAGEALDELIITTSRHGSAGTLKPLPARCFTPPRARAGNPVRTFLG